MAWTAPMTAVDGAVFSSYEYNLFIRDNLNETAPAKASLAGGHFVVKQPNEIVQQRVARDFIATSQSTGSDVFADLGGPTVTVECRERALVFASCHIEINTSNRFTQAAIEMSGETNSPPQNATSIMLDGVPANNPHRKGISHMFIGLNPGIHTFTMKYRIDGTGVTATFTNRELVVFPL